MHDRFLEQAIQHCWYLLYSDPSTPIFGSNVVFFIDGNHFTDYEN